MHGRLDPQKNSPLTPEKRDFRLHAPHPPSRRSFDPLCHCKPPPRPTSGKPWVRGPTNLHWLGNDLGQPAHPLTSLTWKLSLPDHLNSELGLAHGERTLDERDAT